MNDFKNLPQVFVGCLGLFLMTGVASGHGLFLPAGGAVNRGMGGATTGAAIDAVGSMFWNPATINQLGADEVGFGFELIYANQNLASTFPAAGSGSTDADTGWVPVPTIAWVHQTENPNVTFGLGILGVGGFAINAPADVTNPILSPPFALGGAGVGGIKAEAQFFELAPAFSLRLTEKLSMGVGPVVGMGKVTIDDNAFAGLNANGTYPRGDGTRFHWGLGFQLGLHYVHNCCWELGVNFKSPVWFESLEYLSEDEDGLARRDEFDLDLPTIVTTGIAYRGFQDILLAADFRYIGYGSTDGLGDSPRYQANGAANGLGWDDVFTLNLGAQLQLTERLIGRVGYIYASELFDDSSTFFNLSSELSYRHSPTCGASYQLNDHATISAAYNYLISWDSSGPYVLPGAGAIPGSSVSTDFDAHIVTVGLNVRY